MVTVRQILPAPPDLWKVVKPSAYRVKQSPDLIEVPVTQIILYALTSDGTIRGATLGDLDDRGQFLDNAPGEPFAEKYRMIAGHRNAMIVARVLAEAAIDQLDGHEHQILETEVGIVASCSCAMLAEVA